MNTVRRDNPMLLCMNFQRFLALTVSSCHTNSCTGRTNVKMHILLFSHVLNSSRLFSDVLGHRIELNLVFQYSRRVPKLELEDGAPNSLSITHSTYATVLLDDPIHAHLYQLQFLDEQPRTH